MGIEQPIGSIGWIDLTVDDAENVREFYRQVTGWNSSDVSMGDYEDYCMIPAGTEDPVAGICHKRGANESMPSQWMIYVNVSNLADSKTKCAELGGKVLVDDRSMGSYGTMCVIEDPAGAVIALIEPKT